MPKTAITRADIMALEDYLPIRKDRRREMAVVKKARRMEVGPFCTFYFESYETMLHQVHEMLAIEKGGEAQIPDELEAYNPLVPQGKELTATVMFEIDDEVRRKNVLNRLGGVEEHMFVEIGGERIMSRAEEDAEAILSEARQRASAVERDAYEKGLEEGRKTGEIMAEQQLQVVLTQYHHSLTALDQMRDLMINQNQLEIMELVVHIAQKVLNAELTQNPAAILPMIKNGLNSLKQRKELIIYLNADDHEFVVNMADSERQKWIGTQAQVEVDTALGRGSFRIETAAGELDANIEAQLLQVQENLASSIEI